MGRNDQAIEEARRVVGLNPLSTGGNGNLGSVFVFTRHWDKAIEQLRYAIDLDRNYWFDYCFLGRALEQRETCLKRSRRFNAAWRWKTTLNSGQVSATPTRFPETRQGHIRSSIIWKICLLRGT